jgi:hypothetical protein
LVSTILFLSIIYGVIKSFSFTIFELRDDNLYIIISILPAIISYQYYELMALFCMRRLQIELHEDILRTASPELSKSNLDDFYLPASTFVLNNIVLVKEAKSITWKIFMRNIGGLLGILTVFIPLIFCVYTYVIAWVYLLNLESIRFFPCLILSISFPICAIFTMNGIHYFYKMAKLIFKEKWKKD